LDLLFHSRLWDNNIILLLKFIFNLILKNKNI